MNEVFWICLIVGAVTAWIVRYTFQVWTGRKSTCSCSGGCAMNHTEHVGDLDRSIDCGCGPAEIAACPYTMEKRDGDKPVERRNDPDDSRSEGRLS